MNDAEVLDQVRDATADLYLQVPLETIVARGRAHKSHRRRFFTAAGAAVSVALAAAAVGIEHAQPSPARPGLATAQLTAFTVSTTPSGATALTLRKGAQYRLDPVALREALADHGVPTLVTVGKTCDTNPEPNGLDQVVSATKNADGAVYLAINGAAMPSGSELSIGYYSTGTSFGLIEAGAPLHCAWHPPGGSGDAAQPRPVGSN